MSLIPLIPAQAGIQEGYYRERGSTLGPRFRAFDATMHDPAFTSEAAKIGFAVDPLTGEQVQAPVDDLAKTPSAVAARVRAALNK